MDDNTKLEVKPIVSPTVPVPIKRRMAARTSFTIEEEIIMIGSDLVFNEAITTERNSKKRT